MQAFVFGYARILQKAHGVSCFRNTTIRGKPEMAETTQKYEEALKRASGLVAVSAKKIEELEARGGSQANDQSHERNECEEA